MSNTLKRIGVAGCGCISKLHLESINEAGLIIAAVCDIDKSRAEDRKQEYGDDNTQLFTDFDTMVRDSNLDIITICTPPMLHQQQAATALKAGIAVYCEKPVCATLGEFDALYEAEREGKAKAYFTPGRMRGGETPMIKDFVDDGDMGDVYRVHQTHFRTRGRPGVDQMHDARWFADSKKAITGISGDMGMYFMDRCFDVTGWPTITSVSAQTYRQFPYDVPDDVNYDVEEHIALQVRTTGKLVFTFEFANIAYVPYHSALQILGTGGGITQDNMGQPFKYMTEKGGDWRLIETQNQWSDKTKSDITIYRQIADELSDHTPVTRATTLEQVHLLHQVLAAAFRSAAERREIRLDELVPHDPIFIEPGTVHEPQLA